MEMTDESRMPFGKFKGMKLANVDSNYLLWVAEQSWCSKELKQYIEDNREVLEKDSYQY